jgi:hypothetical protein
MTAERGEDQDQVRNKSKGANGRGGPGSGEGRFDMQEREKKEMALIRATGEARNHDGNKMKKQRRKTCERWKCRGYMLVEKVVQPYVLLSCGRYIWYCKQMCHWCNLALISVEWPVCPI